MFLKVFKLPSDYKDFPINAIRLENFNKHYLKIINRVAYR